MGRPDVDQMLSEMSIDQFEGWLDFYYEEPWGYELEISNSARIWAVLVNGLYNPKEQVVPLDFYPDRYQPVEPDEPDCTAWITALGGNPNGKK